MKAFKNSLLTLALALCASLTINTANAGTTRTDNITAEEGGPVTMPAGATVPSTGTLTVAGTTTLSGATTISGAQTATGGITVPTASATGTVYSYSAAVTLTAGTNVAAVVTPVTLEYFRVGKQVCAYGGVSIDPTSGAAATVFTLTLPVVPTANFSGITKLSGNAGIAGAEVGSCYATDSAKTATCKYISGGTAVEIVPVHFCYSATGA